MDKYSTKILTLSAILIVIVSSIAFAGTGTTGLAVPRNNLAWLLLITFILVSSIQLKSIIYFKKKDLLYFPLILTACLPFLFNKSFEETESYLRILSIFLIVVFYFSLFQYKKLRKTPEFLLLIILLISLIQLIYGSYQTIMAIIANHSAGRMFYDPAALGVFNQKNLFASFLSQGMILSLYLSCKSNFDNVLISKLVKISSYIFALLGAIVLVYSNSRVGYLGLILGLIFIGYRCYSSNREHFTKFLTLMFLGLAIVLINIQIQGHVEKEFTSAGSRATIYKTSINAIKESPVIGHGLGSYSNAFRKQIIQMNESNPLPEDVFIAGVSHPHNELLYWGIEGGLVSLIAILLLLLLPLFKLNLKSLIPSLGLLFPILLHTQVEHPFYLSTLHLITYALLAAYINLNSSSTLTNKKISTKTIAILVTPVCAIIFIAVALNFKTVLSVYKFINDDQQKTFEIEKHYVVLGWQNDYQFIHSAYKLQNAIPLNDTKAVEEYVAWGETFHEHTPRIEIYQNITNAYLFLGNIEKSLYFYHKMLELYPGFDRDKRWEKAYFRQIEQAKANNTKK